MGKAPGVACDKAKGTGRGRPWRAAGPWLAALLAMLLVLPAAAAKEPLRSGAEPDYPPLSGTDPEGRATGFAVALLRAAVKAVDRDIRFKVAPWAHLKKDLAEGRLDALPLVGRTPEREKMFDFTMPYLKLHGTIVVREGTDSIRDVTDLKGRRVAVMDGDNAEEFMRRKAYTDRLVATPSFEDALRRLAAGEVAAVVVQRLVALQLMERLDLEGLTTRGRLEGFRQDFCFAVQEGDERTLALLNEGLAVVIANGTRRRLKDKWLGVLQKDYTGTYVTAVAGAAAGILLLVLAVTALWQISLRREVRRRTEELRQRDRERERIVAELSRSHTEMARLSEVMAHHFQEPARRMVSFAQRLRRQLDNQADAEAVTESMGFIEDNAQYLSRLVRDAQRFLEADRPREPIATLDVEAVAREAADQQADLIREKGATVTIDPLPPARIDRPRLLQILVELLANALRHAGTQGAPHVHVSGELSPDGAWSTFHMADNGPGIAPEQRERVFRLFERLPGEHGAAETGLGLAIVRRIAVSLGGDVRIESAPGGGACVVVTLPADAARAETPTSPGSDPSG